MVRGYAQEPLGSRVPHSPREKEVVPPLALTEHEKFPVESVSFLEESVCVREELHQLEPKSSGLDFVSGALLWKILVSHSIRWPAVLSVHTIL